MKLSLLSLATLATAVVADLDPIVIKGSKFFYSSNNTQFYLRGVVYQQDTSDSTSYKDPLADATACKRDIPILQELRTNVIRTYSINASADHSECMKLLSEAGIYLISDLSDPTQSIDRSDPNWLTSLYSRYTSVIDELSQYNNTIGFFAGNEVANTVDTTDSAAFVKAAVRDMKSYIKEKGYRSMGVGYATADVSSIRVDLANYFDCVSDDESVDFWGYNIYSWCGNSTYAESGYKDRTEQFRNYTVPVFFAEYGCNEVTPRTFTEVKALYGDTMAEVWSGGIVYMYFQETNNYGLVSVVDTTSVSTMPDFKYYSSEIASANPTGTNKASYTPTNTVLQSCPTVGSDWQAKSSPLPPTPDANLCDCIYDESACVASSSLSTTKMASLLSTVCGYTDCSGVSANATTGEYGAYSMCEIKYKLAFALNKYYTEQDKDSSACDFSSSAATKATTAATGTCSAQIKEAGTAGTGTVTTEATATAGSSSSSSTSSSAGAPITLHSSVTVGYFQIGFYAATALFAGLGMILL
ncbi:1,3-beta-glucanosyltransferase [Penicillium rolfsii]|nr:1,3-beta-glucanosyltransferase [Penicillium rolfsii]